jgi:catechol 2,3-dioxygenase-like lactoylglutathione lyase family enzyme
MLSNAPVTTMLPVKDLTRARAFYEGKLGLKPIGLKPDGKFTYDCGGATLALFHGSPRSHMEDLLATTPPEQVDDMLSGLHATVMAGGHTHVQMLRQHRGTLVVNAGSVGAPFKEFVEHRPPTILAHAEYATVEASAGGVQVTLRRVEVDKKALWSAASGSSNPLGPMLARNYV